MALMRNRILQILNKAIVPIYHSGGPSDQSPPCVELEIPKVSQHGDYASNIALSLTRCLKRNPREIAKEIVQHMEMSEGLISKVEIAGPGFLNFFIEPGAWHQVLVEVHAQAEKYGYQEIGKGKRVQVEFVSANPTGPLHIGHGRGAATGDVMAALLAFCGYAVEREYYINDAGNQMDTLGRSL